MVILPLFPEQGQDQQQDQCQTGYRQYRDQHSQIGVVTGVGMIVTAFGFGVRFGMGADDDGKGQGANAQSNNTAINQSFVVGLRLSL